ncbi:tetraacyldisaccharide 4'-kinase [Flavobacterium sp. MAH-1]|uniref:Tetraacyldisaccharide 4'-kinase n=1 Tax=Flavobacterium agri TaxID=2743471 RepID=A0A7Y8Y308_9FLAO|nr:tetraacyldisaccharide 4'-kinase [Flavobacterium agri]NUY80984.1 tetraacyldisaccharide 4'-kinase [Flavobacterium agri]NYA71008.1 tetraacyldisaccharide 4'-kinase [Flavobacterium agri]
MILIRKILFPFAAIYGLITGLRNWFYDIGIFKSAAFDVPVIAVGNLSVGGTGKSPQIEYLLRLLIPNYKVATLSRGYKRKSRGFVLADENSDAQILGDEPFQFHRKFPEVAVAVDADRVNGITKLLELAKPDVILLDDAFQHRKVKAGFYILLTTFHELYIDDFLLPTGNLRESRRGAKRADIIVVTKCPKDLSQQQQNAIRMKMRLESHQQLFFSFIDYDDFVFSDTDKINIDIIRNKKKVLIAGIAKPKPFFEHLKSKDDVILEFSDHHHFSESEISEIVKKANGNPIVTTEKDYVRLKGRKLENLFYLPIKSAFVSGSYDFDGAISQYVSGRQFS